MASFAERASRRRSHAGTAENLRFVSRHVLLTGFEPFGTHLVNPSELLARSLEGRVVAGRATAVRIFPVETRTLRNRIDAAIHEVQPEFIVGTGFSAGRVAVGTMRKDDVIQRGGPDARLTTAETGRRAVMDPPRTTRS